MATSVLLEALHNRPAKRRRRGGCRQRAADAIGSEDEDDDLRAVIGNLGLGLLLDFCDGWLSASRLCKHMFHSCQDGTSCALATRLGAIGGASSAAQHSNEGVLSFLESLPPVGIIDEVTDGNGSVWTHFIKPSRLFHAIETHYPRHFRGRLGADPPMVKTFWERFLGNRRRKTWAQDHVFIRGRTAAELKRAIPLVMHEDAGPCSKEQPACCISVSSLLGSGSEKVTKYLLATAVSVPMEDVKVWEDILADRTDKPYTDLQSSATWRTTENMSCEEYTGLDDALLEHEKKYLQKQSYTDSEIELIAEEVKDLKDTMEKGRESAGALRAWFRLT